MPPESSTPYTDFNFQITIDCPQQKTPISFRAAFQEISGLGAAPDLVEQRPASQSHLSTRKIPGLHKADDVTLKRGLAPASDFYSWLETLRSAPQPCTLRIALLDDTGAPLRTWSLHHARPLKYTGPSLASQGTDVAIEELVLAHEGIEIED